MADFTYLFADAVTNQILGALPLTQVSFSETLNAPGSFTGTLNMADARVIKALANLGGQAGGLLQPGRTIIYVDYGGVLIWGYMYWGDTYDNSTAQLTVTGSDLWSYLAGRTLAMGPSYTNQDQLLVAADLVNKVQAVRGGSIGVTVPAVTSGQNITVAWDPNQMATVGSAYQQLAQQSGVAGFDYMVDVAWSVSGVPTKLLTLSYPRRGRTAAQTGMVFDAGSKWAAGLTWQRDATIAGNTFYGVGAGSGPATAGGVNSPLRSNQSLPQLIDAGYPLLEQILQRSDITSQTLLDRLTRTALIAQAYPVIVPQTTFDLAMPAPKFGSWLVGDDARLILGPAAQDLFPSGADSYWRIVQQQVTVGDEGESTVQITWNAPPAQ